MAAALPRAAGAAPAQWGSRAGVRARSSPLVAPGGRPACRPALAGVSRHFASGSGRAPAVPRAVRADQAAAVDASDVQLIADVTKDVDTRLAAALAAASAAAATLDLSVSSPLRERVAATIAKVQKGLLERETEVSGCGRRTGGGQRRGRGARSPRQRAI